MFKFIKKKITKRSTVRGGVTFSDQQLFDVNSKFKYVVDFKNKKIVILQVSDPKGNRIDWERNAEKLDLDLEESLIREGTISRKGKNQIPLIDIRHRVANGVFEDAELLQISLYEDTVIVEGYTEDVDSSTEQTSKKTIKSNIQNLFRKSKSSTDKSNLVDITNLLSVRKKYVFQLSKKQFKHAIGEQLSFDLFEADNLSSQDYVDTEYIKQALDHIHIPLQVASFFSGAGIMDQGFKEAGFDIIFALEKDPQAVETYCFNHGEHVHVGDINNFDTSLMMKAPIIIGGPPCQGFSSANRKTNFLDNPHNSLVKTFIDVIKNHKHCQVFVLENVPEILTVGDGSFKEEIIRSLPDFEVTYGILNAANYGCPQKRSRAIFIGSKIGKIALPMATHNEFVTVGEALRNLHDGIPNQLDYSKPRADTLKRIEHIRQGQNWQAIPDHLKTPRMLSGNTHSSVYRRLDENKASITIANPRKSNILNPWKDRILSIRECARLFGLGDDYVFRGKLSSMQQQVANGVPVQLAKAVAKVIKEAISKFNIRNGTESFRLV